MLIETLFIKAKLENNLSVQFQLYSSDVDTIMHAKKHLHSLLYAIASLYSNAYVCADQLWLADLGQAWLGCSVVTVLGPVWVQICSRCAYFLEVPNRKDQELATDIRPKPIWTRTIIISA